MRINLETDTERVAEQLFEKLRNVKSGGCSYDLDRCRDMAPLIHEIESLKRERNAVILAHSYLTPDILYGVADFVGDSYGLSLNARESKADTIVFAAVDFMAETAKILNPEKQVLVPNQNGGCSLADSITADQVLALRAKYPDYTFICYINTTAAVKAVCDLSVTSSNVYAIAEVLENDKIFFVPDQLMGKNLEVYLRAKKIEKTVRWSDGTCYVHEQYDGQTIPKLREIYPEVQVLAHPECKPEVTVQADYVGSTSGMMSWVKNSSAKQFFLLTECGLTGRLQAEAQDKEFVGSCILCKYMKSNSLLSIRDALLAPDQYEIRLDEGVRVGALKNLEAMFHYTDVARERGLL